MIPDPQAARAIAQQAIRSLIAEQSSARRYPQRSHIELAMIEHGIDHTDITVWPVVYGAVLAAISRAQITVSWPDEQPQDEREACGVWLDARQADVAHDHDRPGMTSDSCYCGLPKPCEQRADDMAAIEQLRAVLGRRAELVAENARLWEELEAAQAEQDGDVRAVSTLLAAVRVQAVPAATKRRAERLEIRFAGRIEALKAHDAKEVGSDG